uniref:Putative methyltransferase n=1 Tax=viral metagenome TaxID=1070528 RepID=A0A6H1ZLK2_9ZZZZ
MTHHETFICPYCSHVQLTLVAKTILHICTVCKESVVITEQKPTGYMFHDEMENILYRMKSNSVDLVCTDPPYGVRKDMGWDDKLHFIKQVNGWLKECIRVSKHAVIWFCASKMMPYIFKDLPAGIFHRQLDWKKPKGTQFAGASHNNIWYAKEPILIFSKDMKKTTSYGKDMKFNYDYLEYDTIGKKVWGHKTSKPVPLMAKLIQHYSNEGELVLDPFGGGGPTAEACIKTNRRFIIIEKSPDDKLPYTNVDGDNPDHYGTILSRVDDIINQGDAFRRL